MNSEDESVPDDEEGEEPMEGRLSADTSEQIFISQQIEAKAASEQRQPEEEYLSTVGVDESEHAAVPAGSADVSSSSGLLSTDIDRLQSPEKTPIGTSYHRCHNYYN